MGVCACVCVWMCPVHALHTLDNTDPLRAASLTCSGAYHYHSQPGAGCVYTNSAGAHSPVFAVMADGIPLYGEQGDSGAIPADLDECGGHVDASFPFYHYHLPNGLVEPYTVRCLRGCITAGWPGPMGFNTACTPAATQYDYSSMVIPWLAGLSAEQNPCAGAASSNNSTGGRPTNGTAPNGGMPRPTNGTMTGPNGGTLRPINGTAPNGGLPRPTNGTAPAGQNGGQFPQQPTNPAGNNTGPAGGMVGPNGGILRPRPASNTTAGNTTQQPGGQQPGGQQPGGQQPTGTTTQQPGGQQPGGQLGGRRAGPAGK